MSGERQMFQQVMFGLMSLVVSSQGACVGLQRSIRHSLSCFRIIFSSSFSNVYDVANPNPGSRQGWEGDSAYACIPVYAGKECRTQNLTQFLVN